MHLYKHFREFEDCTLELNLVLTIICCTLMSIAESHESVLLLYKTKLENRVQDHRRQELFCITSRMIRIWLTGPWGQKLLRPLLLT